jgi:hypothetical protein
VGKSEVTQLVPQVSGADSRRFPWTGRLGEELS